MIYAITKPMETYMVKGVSLSMVLRGGDDYFALFCLTDQSMYEFESQYRPKNLSPRFKVYSEDLAETLRQKVGGITVSESVSTLTPMEFLSHLDSYHGDVAKLATVMELSKRSKDATRHFMLGVLARAVGWAMNYNKAVAQCGNVFSMASHSLSDNEIELYRNLQRGADDRIRKW